MLNPQKVLFLNPNAIEIDTLRRFPFLNDDDLIFNLKLELPTYLAAVTGIDSDADDCAPLAWWKQHASNLPNWANAVKQVVLVQPSSAAAERAFSILNDSFAPTQFSSLADYVEISVMLQYNVR